MIPQIDILLQAIRLVLHHEDTMMDSMISKELYQVAYENGLVAILAKALKSSKQELPKRIVQDYYYFIKQDVNQLQTKAKIHNWFHEAGIKHIFLKGSILKGMYPETYLRGMGDLDILVHKHDLAKVHEILEQNNFQNTHNSTNHDSFQQGQDLIVEIHPKLNSEFDEKYNPFFKDEWANAFLLKEDEYRFYPEFECVYLLYHLAKHFSTSGVGLRSLLDIGVYLKHFSADFDFHRFQYFLSRANLERFGGTIIAFQERYFGYSFPKFQSLTNEITESTLAKMFDFVTAAGIHGTAQDFNRSLAGMAHKSNQLDSTKKGKVKYVIALLFPPRRQLVGTYPFLKEQPFLLPVAWLFRFFKLIFTKPVRSVKRLKSLHVNEEELDEATKLFRQIGL